MQKRTAPPLLSYLRYILWQPSDLEGRTSLAVSCKKAGRQYRITDSVSIAGLRAAIIVAGAFFYWAASFSGWIHKALAALITFLLAWLVPGLYSYYHTNFEELPGYTEQKRGAFMKQRHAQVQSRTAPPLLSYLWYYFRQPKRLVDRTSDIVVCRKQKARYLVTKTVHSAWLCFIIFLPAIYEIISLRFPNIFYSLILAVLTGILADVLPGIYSYYRTEFREAGEQEPDASEKNVL